MGTWACPDLQGSLTQTPATTITIDATDSRIPSHRLFKKGWVAMNGCRVFLTMLTVLAAATSSWSAHGESFDGYLVPESSVHNESVLLRPPVVAGSEAVACDEHDTTDDYVDGWINRLLNRCQDKCHVMTTQVDALMLWQGNIPSRPLLRDNLGDTVLDANQAQTEMGSGARFGLFYNLDPCHAIEGSYLWADGFDGRSDVPFGTYDPVTLPDPPVPSPVETAALFTSGQLKSAELNWRWRNNRMLSWLVGFRWVEWNQNAGLTGQGDGGETFALADMTGNDLYGGQIGADLLFWNAGRRFRLNGIGKAGVFGNRAYQKSAGFDDGGLAGPTYATGSQVSFFGEVGMYGDVAITRWLSWRTGYVLFWGTGLALPTENLSLVNFNPPPESRINISESLLVHGVTTGLEARW
jgi:hypothetical protein